MSDTSNQPLQETSDMSNQPLQETCDMSNRPPQEMSDTSNRPLEEMFHTSNQPLQEISDTSNLSLQEMSGMSNQPLQEMSDTSNQPLPDGPEPSYNHACGDLLDEGRRRDYMKICVPLYEALVIGDLKAVKEILDRNAGLNLLGYSMTEDMDTPLIIATTSESIELVKHLLNDMTIEQLKLQDTLGRTALSIAAGFGKVDIARAMVERYPQLLTIRSNDNSLPILVAALFGKHDMVVYLYDEYKSMAGNDWTDDDIHEVFCKCIEADFFDCALKILDDQNNQIGFPEEEYAAEILLILAKKTHAFTDIKSWKNSITWVRPAIRETSVAAELLKKIWKNILERSRDEIDDILKGPIVIPKDEEEAYPFQIPSVAAKKGNIKFLVELIRGYPELLWREYDNEQNIFHIADSHRHESIYNLLYEIGSLHNIVARVIDKDVNNILHLVGMKAKRPYEDVSGAVFQMQRQLLWFKEVNSKVPPYCREEKNNDGRTPLQLFIENHQDMVSKGEKWMKGTASQCMVVAALITTVVFSVAFTIPGGYDQNNGLPIFRKDGPFIAFVILDAISLILSSASILMFLSILTSRYAQEDFLISLPKKLMIGLTTLFLSIITMMVAFAVSFFVLYRNNLISVPIIISVVAVVPIFMYIKLQFPLLVDAYRSTYGSRYLFRPKKRVLYYRNPRF